MTFDLPEWSTFHRNLNLLVCRPRGIVDEPLLERTVALLEAAEGEADEPFNRYIDLSRIDAVDLRLEFLFRMSLRRRAARANRAPTKAALYVTSEATRRIAQTHALLTGNSPLQVRMFNEVKEAANWLGVGLEDLA